jgi:hypothetical protein
MFTRRLFPDRWATWTNEGILAQEYAKNGRPCVSTPLCPCNTMGLDGRRIMDPMLQVNYPLGVATREYMYFHARLFGHKPYPRLDIW